MITTRLKLVSGKKHKQNILDVRKHQELSIEHAQSAPRTHMFILGLQVLTTDQATLASRHLRNEGKRQDTKSVFSSSILFVLNPKKTVMGEKSSWRVKYHAPAFKMSRGFIMQRLYTLFCFYSSFNVELLCFLGKMVMQLIFLTKPHNHKLSKYMKIYNRY